MGRRVITGVRVGAGAMIVVGSWSLYLATTTSSASASTLGGTATITDPTTNAPLPGGGSTTLFTIDLPSQAACSGDTANDGYHVFSYLLAPGTDVTTDSFATGFPSEGLALFDVSKGYYGSASTAPTTGQIIDIPPDFDWALLLSHGQTAADLDGGGNQTWEAGIACANPSGDVTDYWNTEVTFTSSASDPNGFVWTDVPGTGSGSTTTTTSGSSSSTSSTSSTTTSPTTTSTTTPTSTSTTTSPSTTTSTTGSTTSGNATSTTTAAAATAASSGSSGSSGTSGSANDGVGATSASSGSLAFTGGLVIRDLALGLLCIGVGLILLGLSVTLRRDVAPRLVLR